MFCENCGKQIADNATFCPECGAKVTAEIANNVETAPIAQENTAPVNAAANFSNVSVADIVAPKPKKKGKLVALIAGCLAAVVAVTGVVFMFITAKGYEKEVKNYLNYFAEQEDDVETFITSAYLGGGFGVFVNTSKSAEAHEAICKSAFGEKGDFSDMYYGSSKGNSWEDMVKSSMIDSTYRTMDNIFGDWEMSFEIKKSEKLSDSKIDDLQDILDDVVENYEEIIDDSNLKGSSKDALEELIESIDKKIKKAYEVDVQIEIDGDKAELDKKYTFKVAKVGREWIILEGPRVSDFIRDVVED